jgi:hypothetical protein
MGQLWSIGLHGVFPPNLAFSRFLGGTSREIGDFRRWEGLGTISAYCGGLGSALSPVYFS